jgi:hypothetical protein
VTLPNTGLVTLGTFSPLANPIIFLRLSHVLNTNNVKNIKYFYLSKTGQGAAACEECYVIFKVP